MSETTNMSEDASVNLSEDRSVPEWNEEACSPPPANSAVLVLMSRLSAIVPVILGVVIVGCIGVWFYSDPPPASRSRAQGGDAFAWILQYGGDPGRQYPSYTDQLHQQAEDNNEYLRNLQSDINSRMNSGWRPSDPCRTFRSADSCRTRCRS